MGFIKHAFLLSFYYLLRATKKQIKYRDSISEIVSLAGDTDTNAMIAGGMVGAIVGVMGLDASML